MKKTVLIGVIGLIAVGARAAEADVASTTPEQLLPLIQSLAVKYPKLLEIVAGLGTLRLVMKPIWAALTKWVLTSGTTTEQQDLNKLEAGMSFKIVCFLLDWVGSVKVGTQKGK